MRSLSAYGRICTVAIFCIISPLQIIAQQGDSTHLPATPMLYPASDTLRVISDRVTSLLDVEATVLSLNTTIDSLNNLSLPPVSYRLKLDSAMAAIQTRLASERSQHADSINVERDALIRFYHAKIMRSRHRLDTLFTTQSVEAVGQTDLGNHLHPAINLDEFKLPAITSKEVNANVPSIRKLALPTRGTLKSSSIALKNSEFMPTEFPGSDEVKSIVQQADAIKQVTTNAMGKVSEARDVNIKKGFEDSPKIVEQQLEKAEPVQAVKQEVESPFVPKPAMDNPEGLVDRKAFQEVARLRNKKVVGNYLTGKEQTIVAAMEKMGKLQRKFDQVKDIRKPPKKVQNTFKSKSFIERFVPGIQVQISPLDSRWKNFDISPNASYLFHQNVRAGISGTFRLGANPRGMQFKTGMQHFEWRVFGDMKIFKGFYAHLEAETATSRSLTRTNADRAQRKWNETINVGIFKTYRITKYVRGTTVVLYDLQQIDETFNFGRLAVRFGIEFTFKRKRLAIENPIVN